MKKNVVIGIPAHNEEQNIANLLDSILVQKQNNFSLESIIVACDGCTDKTSNIVKSYQKKNLIIKLINDGKRVGQAERLNNFYKSINADIFITFDADTILANPKVVSMMVDEFKNSKVGLVAGRNVAFKANNLFEKIVTTYENFWTLVTNNINNGSNVHNHIGRSSAIRKEIYKKISIQKEAVANDHYLFFKCLELGYKFKFAKDAAIFFRVPNNLHDYLVQANRWSNSKSSLDKYFGEWINDYYKIPTTTKLKAYLISLAKSPFYMVLAIILQFILKLSSFKNDNSSTPLWENISSSKIGKGAKI
jgi:poly-beta-1,6-N-acetyl-D-glucosamine synthase